MKKIEYTCDRCGEAKPSYRMYTLDVRGVFVRRTDVPDSFKEMFERMSENGIEKDLCDSCRTALNDWLEHR